MARADKAGSKSMASGAGIGRGGYQQTDTGIAGRRAGSRKEGPRRGSMERLGTHGKKTTSVNRLGGQMDSGASAGEENRETASKKSPKRSGRKDPSDLDREEHPASKHGERFDKRAVTGRQAARPGAGDVGRQKGTPRPGSAQSNRRNTKTGRQGTQ